MLVGAGVHSQVQRRREGGTDRNGGDLVAVGHVSGGAGGRGSGEERGAGDDCGGRPWLGDEDDVIRREPSVGCGLGERGHDGGLEPGREWCWPRDEHVSYEPSMDVSVHLFCRLLNCF